MKRAVAMKRAFYPLLAVVFGLLVAAAIVAYRTPTTPINVANYERVSVGMHRDKVFEILGASTDIGIDFEYFPEQKPHALFIRWTAEHFVILVFFDEDWRVRWKQLGSVVKKSDDISFASAP